MSSLRSYSYEEVERLFFDALAAIAQQERTVIARYGIFLGNSLYPMNDQVYATPGHARNSLYHNLSNMIRFLNYRSGNQQYAGLMQWFKEHRADGKRRLVDAAIAAGLVSIKEVVTVQGSRQQERQPLGVGIAG